VLRGVAIFAVVIVLLGTLVWRLERRHSPDEYGGHAVRGIIGGALWTLEALFGTSKSLSRRIVSRLFAIAWAAICIVLLSALTAKFSSELTVNQLSNAISGPSDLPRAKVGAVAPSPSATYLERRGISYRAYEDTQALVDGLAKGDVDAAVGAAVSLQYRVNRSYSGQLIVLPSTFQNVGVGFGLRIGSPLRKRINLALLTIVESPEWQQTVASYLGSQ
jgi:ABC-type amino acid transport substrate-binding protein